MFDFLFHFFTDSFTDLTTYRGYRLMAGDGSELAISYNPNDSAAYRRHNWVELNQKGYKQLHFNVLYDLSNRIYLDAFVRPGSHPDEAGALITMLKRSPIHKKNYLIRIKAFGSRGTITNLPVEDFPLAEIKKLYWLRWGIERSFRELKYTIGLTNQ